MYSLVWPDQFTIFSSSWKDIWLCLLMNQLNKYMGYNMLLWNHMDSWGLVKPKSLLRWFDTVFRAPWLFCCWRWAENIKVKPSLISLYAVGAYVFVSPIWVGICYSTCYEMHLWGMGCGSQYQRCIYLIVFTSFKKGSQRYNTLYTLFSQLFSWDNIM